MAEKDHIEVAVIERTVYLKPLGFATQANSLGIPDFIGAMFRAGCNSVTFDLACCKGMDSTFLGVIAEAATARVRGQGRTVVVLNADEMLARQLCRIGLLPMVSLHQERVDLPEGAELRQIDFLHFPKTEYERLQKVRELHERLSELNEHNRLLFGPFLRMLEEELAAGADNARTPQE
ncbi:MAG: hypothetical protein GXY85_02475 [Candidatus Brocadiaceae bacterium]|nr:hypothetical protein [Candidatus Brocadiaceae bacterium]